MRILLRIGAHLAALSPLKKTVFTLAVLAFLIELGLRHLAPRSALYARWTRGMEAVGGFWTGIILSIVYFVSVAFVSGFMKLFGKDPLDRSLKAEATFWRRHDPNPLGPEAASRHQF
jgi:hypothetical protein